jgi:hypothetical protein
VSETADKTFIWKEEIIPICSSSVGILFFICSWFVKVKNNHSVNGTVIIVLGLLLSIVHLVSTIIRLSNITKPLAAKTIV